MIKAELYLKARYLLHRVAFKFLGRFRKVQVFLGTVQFLLRNMYLCLLSLLHIQFEIGSSAPVYLHLLLFFNKNGRTKLLIDR